MEPKTNQQQLHSNILDELDPLKSTNPFVTSSTADVTTSFGDYERELRYEPFRKVQAIDRWHRQRSELSAALGSSRLPPTSGDAPDVSGNGEMSLNSFLDAIGESASASSSWQQ